ncbi:AAA family ATPase [Polluticaenibacter yanchengensis]|uniref:AAA family ATPase n=1 Tax=Polluticaenibacter yanchengensis TaxID=3014562 RepID=A0ABT4UIL2_9BACT|nr:AAA family ATPase [Chitinophagaceae bacterium LY-5]
MGILDIKPAKRGGSKAIIAIAGVSGSGKTFTALKIARGMVSHPSKIGFLDTENKRGSLYADILDAPFLIGDLYPPFSPSRYGQAIKEFQDAGVEVLVIDSGSHEWEGEGGCEDIANLPLQQGKKMANWVGAKREHKSFMNTLLQCNMNIIVCLRAREKTDFKDPNKPVSLGVQPICEKNFMFEMTASLLMENEGKRQTFLKLPFYLHEAFGSGNEYLGEKTGQMVIQWLNTGEQEDPELKRIKSEMTMAAESGLTEVVRIWNTLTAKQKRFLESHKNICKESAEEYERLRNEAGYGTDSIDKTSANSETDRIANFINNAKTLEQLAEAKDMLSNEFLKHLYTKRLEEFTNGKV